MNFYIRVALVVLQADVEMWAVLLDQVHFKDQGFQFGTHHDPFNFTDFAHHLARFSIQLGAGMEIGTQAVAQIYGFAYVYDLALFVFHDITTGPGRGIV
jgi:hypothetical protein